MDRLMNADCWLYVLDYLREDPETLFSLLLVDKSMFRAVVPVLYRRPLVDFMLGGDHDQTLLKLLRQKPSVRRSRRILTGLPPTIDYYALVQEMPNPFPTPVRLQESYFFNDTKRDIVAYLCDFGPKIKEITLLDDQIEILERHIKKLSHLHTLKLGGFGAANVDIKKRFRQVIIDHKTTFPGVLAKVAYLDLGIIDWALDPAMMLMIRDAMDGHWAVDFVILRISKEKDDNLLRVLEDVNLPKGLRSVVIHLQHEKGLDHWYQPLRTFLSRCRVLDRLELHNLTQPEVLSWAFEEQQSVASGVMAASDQVQWKSLRSYGNMHEVDLPDAMTVFEKWENLWKYIVVGLGHCLKELEFEATRIGFETDEYPVLSLPHTICLPKLRSLSITYPRFAEVAYTGVERLRELDLNTIVLCLDGNGQWQNWKNWKSLESLRMDVQEEVKVNILNGEISSPLNLEKVQKTARMESKELDNHLPNTTHDQEMALLPALKKVLIEDRSGSHDHFRWLLHAPNLSEFQVYYGMHSTGALDFLCSFYEEAIAQSRVLPNLRKFSLSPLHINDENAVYVSHLVGLASGIDLFPALNDICLGRKRNRRPRSSMRKHSVDSYASLKDAVIAVMSWEADSEESEED